MKLFEKIRTGLRRKRTWIIGVPVIVLLIGVGGPFIYLRMVSGDHVAPLSFDQISAAPMTPTTSAAPPAAPGTSPAPAGSTTSLAPVPSTPGSTTMPTTTAPPVSPLAGSWQVGGGSEARYGVDDTLMGQTTRVIGRTSAVSGTMQVDDRTITAANIVVDMQSVSCGCMHDPMYGQMLETGKFPTATFDLTGPITLHAGDGVGTYPASGTFTVHGNTVAVDFPIQIKIVDGRIAGIGSIPIDLASFDVRPPPDAGPVAGLSNPTIDMLIVLGKVG